MSVKSSPPFPPVPLAVAGVDVNFCKNPTCANFGVPAVLVKWRRTKDSALSSTPGTAYSLTATGLGRPALRCLLCGETFSVKSNLAAVEEVMRFSNYLLPGAAPHCPNTECSNREAPVSTVGAYYRFGTTQAGAVRWRCRACGTTFSHGGRALRRQRITHLNKTILLALTNKMPLRRIAKVAGIGPATLYGKLDFLHRQCLAFAGAHERVLLELEVPRLYVSIDRQAYSINWTRSSDRRNLVLRAVGSCDNDSGYVFGMHLNFDPTLDPVAVAEDAAAIHDTDLPYPHRKYARLWLESDYEEALVDSAQRRARTARESPKRNLGTAIADAYAAAASREDSEISELKNEDQKLPETRGMQVHEEYSLYGHFLFLKGLLRRVEKLRFFLDQDSGMRAACFAAFAQDIRMRRVDAFYVRAAKEMTIDKKHAAITRARAAFKKFHDANPLLTPAAVELELMKAEIERSVTFGKWSDRWCVHPLPNMSEPAKAMCWLTDLGDYDEEHAARLFLRASLHGIDNFFQRVRRSLNPLERPLATASQAGRTWYGYSPYNPALVEKLLDIYRVMHNFVESGKDGKTPAMRLGLSSRAVLAEDLIYFNG